MATQTAAREADTGKRKAATTTRRRSSGTKSRPAAKLRSKRAGPGHPPYRRVLVPLDGSPASFTALREALALAKQLGATLIGYHLLHEDPVPYFDVAPGAVRTHAEHVEAARGRMKRYFERAERLASTAGVELETVYGKGGDAAKGINRAAQRTQADLIVIRSHGMSALGRLLLGSVTTSLTAIARVPVLVLPRATPRRGTRR